MEYTALLAQLLARLDSPSMGVDTVSAAEAALWPAGVLEELRSAGLLLATTPATFLSCPECPDGTPQEVFFREPAGDRLLQAQLFCPRCGFVDLEPGQFERLRLDLAGLARFLSKSLDLAQPVLAHPHGLWNLGSLKTEVGFAELALARGATWADAQSILQLDQAPDLVVLTLVRASASDHRLLCLSDVLHLTPQGLSVDDARLRRLLAGRLASPEPLYLFRREGATWRLRFGGPTCTVRHCLGLAYLAELLRQPGQDIPCLTLYYAVQGAVAPVLAMSSPHESRRRAADEAAWPRFAAPSPVSAELEEKVHTIQARLHEAQEGGDEEREEELLVELETMAEQQKRSRYAAKIEPDPAHDRARLGVLQNIQRAYTAIERHDQDLSAFLRRSVKTGHSCSYVPSTAVPWQF